MRIKSTDSIVGVPILKVRHLLRLAGDKEWSIHFVREVAGVSRQRARNLLACLTEQGFIEPTETEGRIQWYSTTSRGLTLAAATAALPVRRAVAERILSDFLHRVDVVNTSDTYLYEAKTVVLFGSFLSGADPVGDIDLAVELQRKRWAQEKWREISKEHLRLARQSGRRFASAFDRIAWPEHEVKLFLKSRSRTLSIMDLDIHEPLLAGISFKVLVGDLCWQPRQEKENGSYIARVAVDGDSECNILDSAAEARPVGGVEGV